ncbi:hypothetical protein PV04_01455 [Phialophora macrospora]|uniref:DNA2/NAM7 helicase-like C-terminal domain-containing protein n=1 Tax=Phialophora macrospora TaxID=1851006 RepID=A0A0D2GLP8_9EURO|nr:hypothetical protein PV04_01455 [Phialophora macrospora]
MILASHDRPFVKYSIVHNAYNDCDLIILEEACRVSEPASRAINAYYPKCRSKVYVGDKMQLKVVVLSASGDRGEFQDQLLISEMTRLQSNGFPTALFDTQYRMVPEIAAIANDNVYHGLLKNDPSTFVENRPLARDLRAYNVKHHARGYNVVFLDIIHAETNLTATKSRYNDTYVMHGLNEASRLMDTFPEASIAYLTTYQAQYRNLAAGKEKMVAANEAYDRLVVDTIDSRQGDEFDVTIIDLLMVGKPAGFQGLLNRLCVYFTRARNALYILGTKAQIDEARDRWLRSFQSTFLKYRVKVEAETVSCPYFQPGLIDMAYEKAETDEFKTDEKAVEDAWGGQAGAGDNAGDAPAEEAGDATGDAWNDGAGGVAPGEGW